MNQQRGHRGHKDLQVCRQVFDALTYALAEIDDPVIAELVLVSVTPAPNASRVLVSLVLASAGVDERSESGGEDTTGRAGGAGTNAPRGISHGTALARLAAVAAGLRAEVAAELTRKRVPELVFHVGHPGEAGPTGAE